MSVLLNLRWFQSALKLSSRAEVACWSSKRHKSGKQELSEENPKEKKEYEFVKYVSRKLSGGKSKDETEDNERPAYKSVDEIFEKHPQKTPDDDSKIPWISRMMSDPTLLIPYPVELRKRVFRPYGFTYHFQKKERETEQQEQLWDRERHNFLGPDLSAAHFVLVRKGSVKFSNFDKWIDHKDKEREQLPLHYEPEFVLTGIDISKLDLRPEALTNFKNLTKVTHLSMANVARADDWWLDTISGELPSLKHLNISGCPNITYRGISILYRFSNLESLIVEGIEYSPFLEMTFLELEQLFPKLTIYGLEHWETEKKQEQNHSEARETSS